MSAEAVNIYQMFVRVFRKGSQKIFLLRSSLVAWRKCFGFNVCGIYIYIYILYYIILFYFRATKIALLETNWKNCIQPIHFVKSVRIRRYSGPHFPIFRLDTERYRVDADHNNSKYGTFHKVIVFIYMNLFFHAKVHSEHFHFLLFNWVFTFCFMLSNLKPMLRLFRNASIKLLSKLLGASYTIWVLPLNMLSTFSN